METDLKGNFYMRSLGGVSFSTAMEMCLKDISKTRKLIKEELLTKIILTLKENSKKVLSLKASFITIMEVFFKESSREDSFIKAK